MADKEYIEREALREEMEGTDWYHINKNGKLTSGASGIEEALYKAEDVYGVINKQPAADVVEVVRCKNCKWRDKSECPMDDPYGMRDNDFCSYGKRKL